MKKEIIIGKNAKIGTDSSTSKTGRKNFSENLFCVTDIASKNAVMRLKTKAIKILEMVLNVAFNISKNG